MRTDELVTRIQQAAQIDSNQEDWTPTDLLNEATECVRERFSQVMVNTRSGYWLVSQTFNLTPDVNWYRMPARAVVQGMELFCTTSPNSTQNWYQLGVLTNSEAVDYERQSLSGVPEKFCFESDGIKLFPPPQQAQSMQFKYYLRPADLVSVPSYSGVLTSVVTASQLIVTSPDATPVPWIAGSLIDIRNLNGTCEAVVVDASVSSVTDGTNIATINLTTPLTSDQLARLRGDGTQAVMTADTSWVVPLPAELCSALASYTAAVVLVDKGDSDKAAGIVSRCESSIKAAMDLMQPRIKTKPYVVTTRNTYLRRRAGWRSGWR